MITIHKRSLKLVDLQTIKLPKGSAVLNTQWQDDCLVFWYLVDTSQNEKVDYHFWIYGTGNPMGAVPGAYVGTVQEPARQLVWHVFQRAVSICDL